MSPFELAASRTERRPRGALKRSLVPVVWVELPVVTPVVALVIPLVIALVVAPSVVSSVALALALLVALPVCHVARSHGGRRNGVERGGVGCTRTTVPVVGLALSLSVALPAPVPVVIVAAALIAPVPLVALALSRSLRHRAVARRAVLAGAASRRRCVTPGLHGCTPCAPVCSRGGSTRGEDFYLSEFYLCR